MTQLAIRNRKGIATSFVNSPIVNIRSATDKQLTNILHTLEPDAIYENEAVVLIQTHMSSNHRQYKTIKAVMLSATYWDSIMATATLAVKRQLNVFSLTADFLLTGDRMLRILSRLSPRQDRHDKVYEVLDVGGVGQIDLGYPFSLSSLSYAGATPTATYPTTGILEFAFVDVGKYVDVAFVTEPIYNVVKVLRTQDQPLDGSTGAVHPPYAYIFHPSLAAILSVTLPTV